jgi:WD40 repeat protein
MRRSFFKLFGVGAALILVAWAAGNFGSDVASGQQVRTLTEHTWGVWSVAFSPDEQLLASGSYDETIKLWDVSGM